MTADMALDLPLTFGEENLSFSVNLTDIEIDFSLQVVRSDNNGVAFAVIPKSVKGTAGSGTLNTPLIDGKSFGVPNFDDLSSEFVGTALVVLSKRGQLKNILIDKRYNSDQWIEKGYQSYLRMVLDTISLFPPLPPDGNPESSFASTIELFGVISFQHDIAFLPGRGTHEYSFRGRPTKLLAILQTPMEIPLDGNAVLEELASLKGVFDSAAGYFRHVTHRADLGGKQGPITVNVSIALTGMTDEPLAPQEAQDTVEVLSFSALRDIIHQLEKRQSSLDEKKKLAKVDLAPSLLELDALISENPDLDPKRRSTLEFALRTLLESDPRRIEELKGILQARSLHEVTRLQILQILSSDNIVPMKGVDELVVNLASGLSDPDLKRGALLGLRSHSSERVVDYLVSYEALDTTEDQFRNISLRKILDSSLRQNRAETSNRILKVFYDRLGDASGYTSDLTSPFQYDSSIVDSFVKQAWQKDSNKPRALKLLAMRSYRETEVSQELTRIFEANLFGQLSDHQIQEYFIPWAANTKNEAFFKFASQKAPTATMRKRAKAYLHILERRKQKEE